MISLLNSSWILRLTTSSASEVHVHVSYSDTTLSTVNGLNISQTVHGSQSSVITSVANTTICNAPAASTSRVINHISIRSNSGTNNVSPNLYNGSTAFQLPYCTLESGSSWVFVMMEGWKKTLITGELVVTAPTVEVTGGGGGTDLTPVIHNTDTNIVATKNTFIYIPPSTLTANRTIDITDLDTDGDRLEICNHDSSGNLFFAGGTQVYLYEALYDIDAPIPTGSIKIFRIDSKNVT